MDMPSPSSRSIAVTSPLRTFAARPVEDGGGQRGSRFVPWSRHRSPTGRSLLAGVGQHLLGELSQRMLAGGDPAAVVNHLGSTRPSARGAKPGIAMWQHLGATSPDIPAGGTPTVAPTASAHSARGFHASTCPRKPRCARSSHHARSRCCCPRRSPASRPASAATSPSRSHR
jgi:hypothetical protein